MKQRRGAVTQQRSLLAVELRLMLVLLAWLAGLMAATQFMAWYLKYQEALGA